MTLGKSSHASKRDDGEESCIHSTNTTWEPTVAQAETGVPKAGRGPCLQVSSLTVNLDTHRERWSHHHHLRDLGSLKKQILRTQLSPPWLPVLSQSHDLLEMLSLERWMGVAGQPEEAALTHFLLGHPWRWLWEQIPLIPLRLFSHVLLCLEYDTGKLCGCCNLACSTRSLSLYFPF